MAEETKVEFSELLDWNEQFTTLIFHLIASLMLACMVVTIVELGQYLFPGWSGAYLPWLSMAVAFEAMYSRRGLNRFPLFSRERIVYRLAEWVTIAILLKLFLYTLHGFNQLWVDLPLWRQDFVAYFFSGEYLFVMMVSIFVWLLAGIFGSELQMLEVSEKVLRLERETGISEQRQDVRRSLVELILVIGGVMIFLAALMRIDWESLLGQRPPLTTGVLNIMAYFFLALILLSLTQLSILRAHWGVERIPIRRGLAVRWLVYGGFFLLVASLVALVLPTRYSVGLLDVLGFLVNILVDLFSLLMLIVLFPLFLLVSLIFQLFGRQPPQVPPNIPRPPAPLPAGGQPISWLEMLKSVLFWLIFLSVVGYSLFHYINQNQDLIRRLRRVPFLSGLIQFFHGLFDWLRGVNEKVASGVEAGLQRLRARSGVRLPASRWQFTNPRRLSPRDRVLFFYLAMVRRGGEQGFPRHPSQTPGEYAEKLGISLPEAQTEVSTLTERFVEARYSLHPVTPEQANIVKRAWQRLRQAFRKVRG